MMFRTGILIGVWLGCAWYHAPDLLAQCQPNQIVNPGFETVDPPCGPVPPGGLINGSFNQGCMTGWLAGWGTPSVCSNNPFEGSYYACLGANNEGFFQNIAIEPATEYCLSFSYRRLNSGSGTLDVYLANDLVNQPMSNSGNPPIVIQPGWQWLGSFPSTGFAWEYAEISSFIQFDPANQQLLFLDVPTGGLDVGIDDVVLSTFSVPDPNVTLDISCIDQSGGTFVFQGFIDPIPPGWDEAEWIWTFGDGQSATGPIANHTFTDFGTYEICLSFQLYCGCEYTTCIDFEYSPCICDCVTDMTPPSFAVFDPGPFEVSCEEDIPPPVPPVVVDCDASTSLLFEEVTVGAPCDRLIYYIWTAIDPCGNFTMDTQTIVYQDISPPVFISFPNDEVVTCQTGETEFALWLQVNGGAQAINSCEGAISFSYSYDPLPETGCGETIVTFMASDGCDNESTASASFTITDFAPPEWTVEPEDLIFPCSGLNMDSISMWLAQNGGGVATDGCGAVSVTHDFNGDLTSDSIAVVFYAIDECFNAATVTASIILVPFSDTIESQQTTCDPIMAGLDTSFVVNGTCSLVYITEWLLLPSDMTLTSAVVCDPDSAGADTTFWINRFGCDSLSIQQNILEVPDTIFIDAFTCDPLEAGVDTLFLMSTDGCDSLIITTILFSAANIELLRDTVICGSGLDYADTLIVQGSPCDTFLITTYRYESPDTTYLTEVTCFPGDTGLTVQMWTNTSGCDSTVFIERRYTPPLTIVSADTFCFGLEWTEVLVITDQNGCDSIISIFQTIVLMADTLYETIFTCDSTMVGLDTLIRPGPVCDTVVITDAQWIPSLLTLDTIFMCVDIPPEPDTISYISAQGCDSLLVTRYLARRPQIEAEIAHETCKGLEDGLISIQVLTNGLAPYRFSINDGPFDLVSEWGGLMAGSYFIQVEDASGCRDTLADVEVFVGQMFMIEAGPDQEIEKGSIVQLEAESSHPISDLNWWAFDSLSCPSCLLTTLGPVSLAQWVRVTALSDMGCQASDSLLIQVKEEETDPSPDRWYIPNVFSPDGDGINDRFYVSGSLDVTAVYSIEVYDRWGNLVFVSDNESVNDEQGGWDGTFRQEPMNPGVYVFTIRLTVEGNSQTIQGDVTLIW